MTLFENKTPASRLHFQLLKLLLLSVFVSASAIAAPVPTVTVTELQDGLDHPWSLAFLPDNGGILITERSGQLRLWQQGKPLSEPLKGVPAVYAKGQGGLLEVALSPKFAQDRRVYLSFAEEEKTEKPVLRWAMVALIRKAQLLRTSRFSSVNSPSYQPATILAAN